MAGSRPLGRRASVRFVAGTAMVVAFLLPSRAGAPVEVASPAPAAAATDTSSSGGPAASSPSASGPAASGPAASSPAASSPAPATSAPPVGLVPGPSPVGEGAPDATLGSISAAEPAEVLGVLTAIVDDAPSNVTSESPDLVALVQADDGQLTVERVPMGDGLELAEVAAGIAADGTLVSAAFDEVVQLDEPAAASAADAHASTSNDTYRWQQWALDRVPFETSWSTSTGSGVVVAVIDTAVDLSHGDLVGQFVSPYFFTATGSGPGMQSVPPGNFHGTHVSGIIAAVAGNGTGVAGGAPGVKIMPIEVLNGSGSGRYSDITAAIVWATDHGADVINLSLGGAAQFGPLDVAVAYAGQHGVLVMAAAGNDGCSVGNAGCAANYPAASPGAIAIGSVTSDLSCSAFTTRADYVALGAPGSSVVSTAPTNLYSGSGYVSASGTSMATPYASAAAAILVAAHPERAALDIRDALFTSAVDVAEAGNDTCTGHGLIDPVAALDELDGSSSTPGPTSPTSLDAPRLAGVLAGRGMVRLSFVAPPGATSIFVRRDGVLLATIAANRRSFTDRTVFARSPYTYEISAWSATAGEGPRSVTRTVTTRG